MATAALSLSKLILRTPFLYQTHRKNWCITHNPTTHRFSDSWNWSFSSSSFSSMSNNTTAKAGAGTDQPPSEPLKTVRVVIKGRVQGVFYRNWTVENARGLGLRGWVRNRRDGSVEALFSGNPNTVDEMEQRCRRGPPHAHVTSLQVFPSDDDPGQGFDRWPTVV